MLSGVSSYGSSTESLAQSINEYLYENGRRYHTYFGVDKYVIPTDDTERDRLDINHEVLLHQLDGELHGAPMKNPKRILDVGTGTGIWAIDMAEKHPYAEVLGIDLSPTQPSWVPPNCRFEVDDADDDWVHASDSFDFIHLRNLNQGIQDWGHVMSEAYRCVKPGGYIELSEAGHAFFSDDNSMAPTSAPAIYSQKLHEGMCLLRRKPVQEVGELEKRLRDAGVVDIQAFTLKQVFGPWAKDLRMKKIGVLNWAQAETAFHAYGMAAFTRALGMTAGDADRLCRETDAATRDKNIHLYTKQYVCRRLGGGRGGWAEN
ncbi:S-adenosyl-L-methionine-dependent methyltransferase [Sphaerosporella brunnea]|uniref:S-adenosyl-L-methionine-dependent methyltransferase n=1 Tax=Sphaerosporella brunnea TaxID=1250544 RepID=A0A5J5F8A5_9PEZI|nr:S-adenosyl-L-methionine-dependent methyltransferase [Sphaerosporella brunnea]